MDSCLEVEKLSLMIKHSVDIANTSYLLFHDKKKYFIYL